MTLLFLVNKRRGCASVTNERFNFASSFLDSALLNDSALSFANLKSPCLVRRALFQSELDACLIDYVKLSFLGVQG